MNERDIKKSMATGSAWMVLFNVLNRFIGIISTMIMARILVPEDYGLVAMAMSIYVLIELLSAFGFDVVLIQKTDIERSDYDSAWTIKLIFYSVLSTIFFFSAEAVASFYKEDKLVGIVQLLSVAMFLTGLDNIKLVDLRRNLNFQKEFLYQVNVKIIGFCVAIPLVFWLQNYWALVIGQVASRAGALLLGYYYQPYIPRLNLSKAKEIFNFSSWVLITNILNFASMRLPDFVLGKLLGTRAVGLYSIANEIGEYSSSMIAAPMNRAIYPGYTKLKDDLGALGKSYLEVLGMQALIILPMGFGLSITAEYVVDIILGSKWSDAVAPTAILAIAGAVLGLSSNTNYIYFALGRPRMNFILSVIKVAVLIPTVIYMAKGYGIIGVAWAYVGIHTLMLFLHYGLITKALKLGVGAVVKQLARPLIGSLTMILVMNIDAVNNLIQSAHFSLAKLAATTAIGATVYSCSILIFWTIAGCPQSAELSIYRTIITRVRRHL